MNDADISEAIQSAQKQNPGGNFDTAYRYHAIAIMGLLVWHHVLTLDKEVAFFWRRTLSGACVLFFANRYLALAWSVYNAPMWGHAVAHSYTVCLLQYLALLYLFALGVVARRRLDKTCAAFAASGYALEYSQYVVWAAFSSLRVYALRQKRRWAALVFILSMSPVLGNLIPLMSVKIYPAMGCDPGDTIENVSLVMSQSLSIVARLPLICADAIVVAFTWMTTRSHRSRNVRRLLGRRTTLTSVLYENGGIYFVTLTAMNTFHLLLNVLAITVPFRPGNTVEAVEGAYASLTAILISNFLVSLKEAACEVEHLSGGETELGVLEFARADVDYWTRDVHIHGGFSQTVGDSDEGSMGHEHGNGVGRGV